MLEKKRNQFVQTTESMQAFKEQLNAELQNLERMGSERRWILSRRTTFDKITELESKIDHIQSGNAMREFGKKMASFKNIKSHIESRHVSQNSSASNVAQKEKEENVLHAPVGTTSFWKQEEECGTSSRHSSQFEKDQGSNVGCAAG